MIEKHFIISNKIDSLDKKFSIDSLKLKNLKRILLKFIHRSELQIKFLKRLKNEFKIKEVYILDKKYKKR